MDMLQIRYFTAVAETLNFRRAAKRLGISQSSVSRQISVLEQELETKLFIRTNRSVSLTDEGAALLPHAQDIVAAVESAEFLMERFKQGTKGHLSISAVSTSSTILTDCLAIFFKKYPAIVVDVTLNIGKDQVAAMTGNKYDFHFAHLDMLPADGRMDWIVTHKDRMVIVVPKGHSLTQGEFDFRRLENERFLISMEPGSPLLYNHIMSICKAHGYIPDIMNRYDKVESVMLAINAGLGVSIMPETLPKVFFPNSLDIIPIEDMNTDREYIAAWPKQMKNPSAKLFLEVVREYIAQRSEKGSRDQPYHRAI
jgi:DNA-binding transcriptional LysR family regulator